MEKLRPSAIPVRHGTGLGPTLTTSFTCSTFTCSKALSPGEGFSTGILEQHSSVHNRRTDLPTRSIKVIFEESFVPQNKPCVSEWEVVFRWWKISLRSEYRSTKPGEAKDSHEEFLENSHLQVQIALIFGARILDYVFNLCEGKFDFLERLSDNLLLNIISYLDLEDIARLSQTSRRFAQLCTSDKLWEKIVKSTCDIITPDMRALAEDVGWRQMFFTNKLQLQRQLRKRKHRQGSQRDSQF
ncbi:F-box only protein 36 [Mustela nigripes]|nr:F-box only protein 36 [Mustela nigripes]